LSTSTSSVCEQLIEIKDQFEENEELFEAIVASDNAEDLLIAIGMALAFSEGAITLNKVGESHLQSSLEALKKILNDFEDEDNDEEDGDE
jgi:hypothetical protein